MGSGPCEVKIYVSHNGSRNAGTGGISVGAHPNGALVSISRSQEPWPIVVGPISKRGCSFAFFSLQSVILDRESSAQTPRVTSLAHLDTRPREPGAAEA